MLRYFFLFIIVVDLWAGWMFVNDDGTLTPYTDAKEYEQTFDIPENSSLDRELLGKEVNNKRKKSDLGVEIREPKRVEKQNKNNKKTTIKRATSLIGKTIYLTFDDGPLSGTSNVISVLKEYDIEATMFMVGKHIKKNRYRKKLFKRAIDEPNILVANHTYSHANGHYRHFYSSANRVVKDLLKTQSLLEMYDTIHTTRICRLAGRNVFRLPSLKRDDPAIKNIRERRAYDALQREGFKVFGWDLQWSYSPHTLKLYKSPKEIVRVIERLNNNGWTRKPNKLILLMHDFTFKDSLNGKENLRELLALLQENGWSFETLENY